MSVGFLHTPNFAAFWPKPRKKRILGQCAGIMQTVLHLTPPPLQMSGSCPKPKKTSRNGKILGQCASIMQTVLHLTPLADVSSCPKTEKTSRNRKILSKTKKNSRNRKKPKKPKILGQWYHVNILLARLVFLVFFDFSRFLSVLDKIFRFLDVFFDFGWFLANH